MIIRGKSRSGAKSLAAHLLKTEKNERVDVLQVRGTMSEDLHEALEEMEALTVCTRCKKTMYHASLSPAPGERLTSEQWGRAADILAEQFGMEQHARVIVLHTKKGEQHGHVVYCRIDPDTMKSAHDGLAYRRHELAAREIEREFGLQRVQGVHVEREQGMPRPERTLELWEMQQGHKTGIDPRHFREGVRALKMQCDNGQSFTAALVEHGVTLCQGDRRALVLVDDEGGVHSLSRAMGLNKAEMMAYLGDLDGTALPTVEEARALLRERNATVAQQPEKEPELIHPQHIPKQGREEAERHATHAHVSATAPNQEADGIKQQERDAERQKISETIGQAWHKSARDPLQFAINLGASGIILAANEQGKFVAVDGQGRVHYLSEKVIQDDPRTVQSAIAATYDGEGLGVASVDEIKAQRKQESRAAWKADKATERRDEYIEEQRERLAKNKTAQAINQSYQECDGLKSFAAALDDRHIVLSRATAADIAASRSAKEEAGKGGKARFPLHLQEGNLYAITRYGFAYGVDATTIKDTDKAILEKLAGTAADVVPSITEARALQDAVRQERGARLSRFVDVQSLRAAYQESKDGGDLIAAIEKRRFVVGRVNEEEAFASKYFAKVAKSHGHFQPSHREGTMIAISLETGLGFKLDAETLNDTYQNTAAHLAKVNTDTMLTIGQAWDVVSYERRSVADSQEQGRGGNARVSEQGGADPAGLAAQGLGAGLRVVEGLVSSIEAFFFPTAAAQPQRGQQYPKRGQIIQDEPITAGNARRMHDVQKRQDYTIKPEDREIKRDSVPHGVDQEYLARIRRMWEEQERERARDQERGGRER